jgi:RNA polymerase sigma-54 factor
MGTPHGIFEMKYFFTPGYTTASGEAISNKNVKDLIKSIVDGEDATRPLSDQEIVAILKKRGLDIARRTVAKYRGELKIQPSNLRRKYDAGAAPEPAAPVTEPSPAPSAQPV